MTASGNTTITIRHTLGRLRANAHLNMTTELLEQDALHQAKKLDEAGQATALGGMPIVVKANVAIAGARQDGASPALADNMAKQDATIITRLKAAGAIPMALANMHELAFGVSSHNAHYGPVGNPHDPTRMTGGSSGGTAAAIAAGAVPAGVASDTGGSGRLPAAFCGCVGFRPTLGRYPDDGILTLSHTLDTLTVMGADIATVAAMDTAITAQAASPEIDQLRLGVLQNPFWTGIDQEMKQLGQGVLDRLAQAGATLIEGNAPEIETLTEAAGFPIALTETRDNWVRFAEDLCGQSLAEFATGIASPDVRQLYEEMAAGEIPPAEAYAAAMNEARPALQKRLAELFDEMAVDAFIFPTLARTAPEIDKTDTINIDGEELPFFPTLTRRALVASVAGYPSISVPGGLSKSGLPFGMELIGRPGRDRHLLGVAARLQAILADKIS